MLYYLPAYDVNHDHKDGAQNAGQRHHADLLSAPALKLAAALNHLPGKIGRQLCRGLLSQHQQISRIPVQSFILRRRNSLALNSRDFTELNELPVILARSS